MKEREEVQRRERLRTSSQSSRNNGDDDEGNFGRLWERAKGFATKKKSSVTTARYSRAEDKLELLSEGNGSITSTELRPTRSTYRPKPDTGIFDDI